MSVGAAGVLRLSRGLSLLEKQSEVVRFFNAGSAILVVHSQASTYKDRLTKSREKISLDIFDPLFTHPVFAIPAQHAASWQDSRWIQEPFNELLARTEILGYPTCQHVTSIGIGASSDQIDTFSGPSYRLEGA